MLIDLWAKLNKPRAVYSDLTWSASSARRCPTSIEEIFQIVAAARDAAIACVQRGLRRRRDACRAGRWTTRPAT